MHNGIGSYRKQIEMIELTLELTDYADQCCPKLVGIMQQPAIIDMMINYLKDAQDTNGIRRQLRATKNPLHVWMAYLTKETFEELFIDFETFKAKYRNEGFKNEVCDAFRKFRLHINA